MRTARITIARGPGPGGLVFNLLRVHRTSGGTVALPRVGLHSIRGVMFADSVPGRA